MVAFEAVSPGEEAANFGAPNDVLAQLGHDQVLDEGHQRWTWNYSSSSNPISSWTDDGFNEPLLTVIELYPKLFVYNAQSR